MICTARMYLSHTGDRYILALAPMKPKRKAPKHNGMACIQSILPFLWCSQVPRTAISAKENSAVAIA